MDALHKRLNMYMQQYSENTRGSTLNMVLFKDAMTHLVKVIILISCQRRSATVDIISFVLMCFSINVLLLSPRY